MTDSNLTDICKHIRTNKNATPAHVASVYAIQTARQLAAELLAIQAEAHRGTIH